MGSKSGNKSLFKTLAVGALALGMVFNAAAGNAMTPDNSSAFDTVWGTDMTVSAFEHDGTSALFYSNSYTARKAREVYYRHVDQMQDAEKRAVVMEFLESLEQYRGQPLDQILRGVDGAVDHAITYKYDNDNYDRSEFWATPYESLARKSGDCEDYALLKYFALDYLGVSQDAIRIVTLQNDGGGHANLIVEGEGGAKYFLNNDGYGNLINESSYTYGGGHITALMNYSAAGKDLIGVREGGPLLTEGQKQNLIVILSAATAMVGTMKIGNEIADAFEKKRLPPAATYY